MSDIVPFGKYKGSDIETLMADRAYSEWLVQQDWFRQRFQKLYALISMMQAPVTETPEHNRLQARFLEDEYCFAFLKAIRGDIVGRNESRYQVCMERLPGLLSEWVTEMQKRHIDNIEELQRGSDDRFAAELKTYGEQLAEYERWGGYKNGQQIYQPRRPSRRDFSYELSASLFYEYQHGRACEQPQIIDQSKPLEILREFEQNGADVVLTFRGGHHLQTSGYARIAKVTTYSFEHETVDFKSTLKTPRQLNLQYRIELKPTMGDDFPAVLRQVKASNCDVVIVGLYTGEGATWDQVCAMFKTSDVSVILESEIGAD